MFSHAGSLAPFCGALSENVRVPNLSNVRQATIGFHEHYRRRATDHRCMSLTCTTCRPNNHPDQLRLSIDGASAFAARSIPENLDLGLPPTPRDVLNDYLKSIGVDDPVAVGRALFREFGSISSLLGASWRRLCRAVGREAALTIHATQSLMQSALEESIMARPVIAGRKDLHRYLRFRLGNTPRESLLAFFLDAGLRLIRIDRIAHGSIADAKFNVAKIIVRGTDLGASAFLLVHNHPSGDPNPSRADLMATARIRYVSKELEMPLIDHLIVAGGEVRSVGCW